MSKSGTRTRTRDTRFGNTAGLPAPVVNPNNSRAIVPYIPTLNGILGLYHEEAITITPTPVNSPANSFSILEKFPGPGMDIDRSNDQMMETEY